MLAASFLGGVTGFGYSLVATPLLLLLGFPLPFVVTVNLALAFVTRIAVAYRFRSYLNRRRVAGLIAGSVPGLWLGVEVLKAVPEATIKLCAGVIAMAAARAALARGVGAAAEAGPRRAGRGRPGGRLPRLVDIAQRGRSGAAAGPRPRVAAQLHGRPGALLRRVERGRPDRSCSSEGALDPDALSPAFLVWLPGSLLGNLAGTIVGPRLPEAGFRRATLAIVFLAGAITALTA